MKTTHPIDHAIVALLLTFEGICWILNELAGFHAPLTAETAEPELIDPRDVYAIEAHFIEPTVVADLLQQDRHIQSEIFGPVITVQRFSDEDEALAALAGLQPPKRAKPSPAEATESASSSSTTTPSTASFWMLTQ